MQGDFFRDVVRWEFYHEEPVRKFVQPVFYPYVPRMEAILFAPRNRMDE